MSTRTVPRRRYGRRRWQFAQTTSHFSISAWTLSQLRVHEPLADVELLVAKMIELEDNGIGLAAVRAGMEREVVEEIARALAS